MAVTGESPAEVCTPPPLEAVVEPDRELGERYRERRQVYRELYVSVKDLFRRI
jgi:xylulokinase